MPVALTILVGHLLHVEVYSLKQNGFIDGGCVFNYSYIMCELVFLHYISMVVRYRCGKCQVLLSSHPCCLSELWYLDLIRMLFFFPT